MYMCNWSYVELAYIMAKQPLPAIIRHARKVQMAGCILMIIELFKFSMSRRCWDLFLEAQHSQDMGCFIKLFKLPIKSCVNSDIILCRKKAIIEVILHVSFWRKMLVSTRRTLQHIVQGVFIYLVETSKVWYTDQITCIFSGKEVMRKSSAPFFVI